MRGVVMGWVGWVVIVGCGGASPPGPPVPPPARYFGRKIALTGRSDQHNAVKWSDRGLLAQNDLAPLRITDFEVIDGGPGVPFTGDCVRNP